VPGTDAAANNAWKSLMIAQDVQFDFRGMVRTTGPDL
jgi:hypothetical protein